LFREGWGKLYDLNGAGEGIRTPEPLRDEVS